MIINNNKKIYKIYEGENTIQRIYEGTNKIFEYIPVGYKECEYLESNGNQYINTGIKGNGNTKIEIDFIPTAVNPYIRAFGYGVVPAITLNAGTVNGALSRYGNQQAEIPMNLVQNRRTVISNGYDGIKKDGQILHSWTKETFNTAGNLYLFLTNGLTLQQGLVGKIYNAKIYDGESLVKNYIPCIDDSNKPCFYDIISKQTCYNGGSGNFNYKLL